jgi:hypothetical protein
VVKRYRGKEEKEVKMYRGGCGGRIDFLQMLRQKSPKQGAKTDHVPHGTQK